MIYPLVEAFVTPGNTEEGRPDRATAVLVNGEQWPALSVSCRFSNDLRGPIITIETRGRFTVSDVQPVPAFEEEDEAT